MADKAIEPGKKSTERYLPEAAWKAMSKAERKKTCLLYTSPSPRD